MRPASFLCLALLSAACARGPNVGSELPLKRVVIYRNGVGYFERSGTVDEERVTFDMQQRMIGDFLASLAIVERGGSSVRSASFPLELQDAETPGASAHEPLVKKRGRRLPPQTDPVPHDPNDMRTVVLHLDGKEHDLTIGYLSETPVWRPSYRVVVHEDGGADLQAWGIVQNLSGEDWEGVQLSLVAGAPLAFQSTLGNPVVPTRPIVSDQGEIIAAMPQAVTSLDKSQEREVEQVGPEQPQADHALEEQRDDGYGYSGEDSPEAKGRFSGAHGSADAEKKAQREEAQRARASSPGAAPVSSAAGQPGAMPTPAMSPRPTLSPPRRLSDLAAVALESGATRYDIPQRITVPNQSASMVLLASQRVPGESVFLYAADPGVPASFSHPFRVARFTNSTGGLLERGPIAVFEKGSFLGQGVLSPLPPKATATVPFALDRSIALSLDRRSDQQGGRLYRIEAGQLFIERDLSTRTLYKIDVGSDRPGKLLVRHARTAGTRLYKPPAGTDDDVASSTAMIPVALRPNSKLELTVDERRAEQESVDWLSELADVAVKGYLADNRQQPEAATALRDAWAVRDKLRHALDEQGKLSAEQHELERASTETRLSLRAIEKNTQAADLRSKLTQRLAELSQRLERVSKRLIELKLTVNEQNVRFRDAVREIRISDPLPVAN